MYTHICIYSARRRRRRLLRDGAGRALRARALAAARGSQPQLLPDPGASEDAARGRPGRGAGGGHRAPRRLLLRRPRLALQQDRGAGRQAGRPRPPEPGRVLPGARRSAVPVGDAALHRQQPHRRPSHALAGRAGGGPQEPELRHVDADRGVRHALHRGPRCDGALRLQGGGSGDCVGRQEGPARDAKNNKHESRHSNKERHDINT